MALLLVRDFTEAKVKVGFLRCTVAASGVDGNFGFPFIFLIFTLVDEPSMTSGVLGSFFFFISPFC